MATRSRPPGGSSSSSERCRCCPYGFHIDLDFVAYAEDVVTGQISRAPPLPSSRPSALQLLKTKDRQLTSPLDSIFSDSLENMMSDFEENLPSEFKEFKDFKTSTPIRRPERLFSDRAFTSDVEWVTGSTTNGYLSDYTSATTQRVNGQIRTAVIGHGSLTMPRLRHSASHSEFGSGGAAPPKPLLRPPAFLSTRAPLVKPNGEPNPPAYSTALAKAMSELKLKSPLQRVEESGESLQAGTAQNVLNRDSWTLPRTGASRTENRTPTGLNPPAAPDEAVQSAAPRGIDQRQRPPASAGPLWRRKVLNGGAVERSPSAADVDGFASLRRGREAVLSDSEVGQHRVRYYSASPKLPRNARLAPVAPIVSSSSSNGGGGKFTYSNQNGHTILSRTQGTAMSPTGIFGSWTFATKTDETDSGHGSPESQRSKFTNGQVSTTAEKPKTETRSVGVATAPLPAPKPCSECPTLKTQIKEIIARTAEEATRAADEREMLLREQALLRQEREEREGKTLIHAGTLTEPLENPTKPERIERYTSVTSLLEREDLKNVIERFDRWTSTEMICSRHFGCGSQEALNSSQLHESATNTQNVDTRTYQTQTSEIEKKTQGTAMSLSTTELKEPLKVTVDRASSPIEVVPIVNCEETASQTDAGKEFSEPRVLTDSEIAESLWLMPEGDGCSTYSRETVDVAVGPDQNDEDTVADFSFVPGTTPTIAATFDLPRLNLELHEGTTDTDTTAAIQSAPPFGCSECMARAAIESRHIGVGPDDEEDEDEDTDSIVIHEVDENVEPDEITSPAETKALPVTPTKAVNHVEATKKLLTTENRNMSFQRGTAISKSCRLERKKGDDLAYIEQQHSVKNTTPPIEGSPVTTPTALTTDALKEKVVLKKEVPVPPSKVPDPVPARIPRPKISKYIPTEEAAETPDEEEEASDRLTPLRSEMRSLGHWPRVSPHVPIPPPKDESESDSDSDDSTGSYETHEDDKYEGTPFEISGPLREALESLNSHLLLPGSVTPQTADWAGKYVQHEWLKTSARKSSSALHVEAFVEALKELSSLLLQRVVNITDQNGNTALHYAVSHGNFPVVSALLDTEECQLDAPNKAGYSAVMLGALANVSDDTESTIVQRLFKMGNVNAKASQHGQTALMLAVSHGKLTTTQLLLDAGADVNIQDEEGSTALMCAAEHGHRDLVKLLLNQPDINASLADCDSSTALSIAVENGHRDIGVLIYAHLNYSSRTPDTQEAA